MLYAIFGERIEIMARDPVTGALSLRETFEVAGAGSISATAMDPSGSKLLYLAGKEELLSLAIEPSTGGLTIVGRCPRPVEDYGNYLQVDRTGRFLLSAYYTAGYGAVHRLGADGHIGTDAATPTSLIKLTQGTHCVKLSLDNKSAYFSEVAAINHVEGSRIHCFDFDEDTGVLTARAVTIPPPLLGADYDPPESRFTEAQLPSNGGRRSRFNMRPELGPRHLCVHPGLAMRGRLSNSSRPCSVLITGNPYGMTTRESERLHRPRLGLADGSLYTSNEQGSSVTHWRPAADGGLEMLSTLETVPDFYPEKTQINMGAAWLGNGCTAPSEIHMHPRGHTLYTTNRGHDSLACFSLHPTTGAPSAGLRAPTSHTPQSFRVDSAGRFLYAAGGPSRSGGEQPGLDWKPDERTWGRITIFRTMEPHYLEKVAEVEFDEGVGEVLLIDLPIPSKL